MTRENKLALIVGFSLLLVVAVLLADHLSPAQQDRLATLDPPVGDGPTINLPAGQGAHRQFGRAENDEPLSPDRRTILIDPPTTAMNTDLNASDAGSGGDDAIARISEFERDSLVGPGFGSQISRESEQPEAIQMGAPVLPPGSELQQPVDRGDATPYTVRDRDTLYGLCKKFYGDGSLYDKLARFNSDIVPANSRLRTGMTLWIPSRSALDGRAEPALERATQPVAESTTTVKTINYTIKENDRLWDLAAHYLGKGHRYKEIVALNRDVITNENVLPIGKTIRIPVR
ncbi:MAG: LysM peptidoglycan-binding domain-containing protein [Phycisphaerales bacterium]|nr:LysM peptidoglycan-binding domain-containing protein [Phycisphaerales bacterium]